MAKWGGEADAAAETAGGGGQKFTPAPRGIYTIQVADFKDGMTKGDKEKGVPSRAKVDLTCEIADDGPEFGKKVWLTITQIPKSEKGHGIMIHSLHAFGLALDGDYEFDTKDLQGQRARVLLGVEQRPKTVNAGTPQEKTFINDVNFVEALYTEKHPEPADGTLPPPREPKKTAPANAGTAAAKPVNGAGKPPAARQPQQQEVPF